MPGNEGFPETLEAGLDKAGFTPSAVDTTVEADLEALLQQIEN